MVLRVIVKHKPGILWFISILTFYTIDKIQLTYNISNIMLLNLIL